MASLPPRPSQQSSSNRRDSSSQPISESSEDINTRNDISESTATLDSQTVLINEPTMSETSAAPPKPSAQTNEDNEPRKCWICFSDETEDKPTTSIWKSPCPCALTAHEACLLDWIADMEAPTNRTRPPKKIQCPQCKTDIQVARPRSILVSSVAAVDRIVGKLTIPGILTALGGSILGGAWFHGMLSVFVVFGAEDYQRLVTLPVNRGVGHKWILGAPLIPMVLIASRTTLADGILPCLPLFFFASTIPQTRRFQIQRDTLWPPSAAMTFAMLPYVRAIYNQTYRRLFFEKEQQWIRELQPRLGQNEDGAQDDAEAEAPRQEQDHAHHHHHHHEGGLHLEVEVIHEDFDDEQDGQDGQQPQQAQAHAEEVHRLWDQAIVQGGNPAPQGQANGGNAQANNANNGGANMIINTGRAADAIMGALCFPVVAAAAGELLRIALPNALTTTSNNWRRPGLLQSRWGRSVIGGCLFVAVKDTLVLYSRYKLAMGQRERKIVDWSQRKDRPNTTNI